MNIRSTPAVLALAACVSLTSTGALAQDFQPFQLNVIGNVANIPQSNEIERPRFEGLGERSNGRIQVRFRTFQELGMKGDELSRLASRGSFDIVALLAGYISGDAPFFIGVDIPGLAASLDEAEQQAEAYRIALDAYLQDKLNVKLLALWPYPHQVLYCRDEVTSLDDLKGRRIRVHGTALSSLVEAIGGIAVSVPFAEVYTSLQRGVADCAATSTVAGNTQKWYEVSNWIVTLPLGWAVSAHVAHMGFWEGLEPAARDYLAREMGRVEQQLWDMARERGDNALSCNMGGECGFGGTQGSMQLYRLDEAELARVREIVGETVLADWATDCQRTYPQCIETWNATIGKVVGLSIER
jgi:TRAP-type C4-dicarboxylate transport system substrate-binding protein